MHTMLTDLNVASNKGLSERFDSTIGAGTVLMPFGGRKQLTPNMAMVAKLPVFGETTTASAMAWGSTRTSWSRTSSRARTCLWSNRSRSWCRRFRT
jgi:FGAM-synthase: phosphoribosylformylglycinamidine synthase